MKSEKVEPYNIYDFPDEAAWLKGRMNGIGGSDASAIVGMNPYKSNIELFEEKTGRRIELDISDKPYVIYGKKAEEPIRELFKLDYPEYQVEHHEFRILQSKAYPFMQASLDGELTDQDGRKGILEIKTTNILQSMQREKWKDRIPDNYYIQVLHYLLVTGYDFIVHGDGGPGRAAGGHKGRKGGDDHDDGQAHPARAWAMTAGRQSTT